MIPGYGGGMSSAKAALESDTRTLGKYYILLLIVYDYLLKMNYSSCSVIYIINSSSNYTYIYQSYLCRI